jgi:hypothetical protein
MMLDPKLECIVFEEDRAETKMVQAPSGMRNFMKLAANSLPTSWRKEV